MGSLWCIAPLKATNADKDKRDPVQIHLPIYFNFKDSLKEETNNSDFIALMHVSRCTNMHTAKVCMYTNLQKHFLTLTHAFTHMHAHSFIIAK